MAGLLMNAWQASADENEKEPTGWGVGATTTDVDDTELNASYGKGYPWQRFQPEVAIPVILWDEGKRKTSVQDTRAVVVTHGRSDIHLQGVERPR